MTGHLAWRLAIVVVAVCICGPTLAQAPQRPPAPTFESSVELVTLDVSVLDPNRRPVRGLTAPDFTVLAGGVPQRIASFKAIDLPDRSAFPAPWMRDIAPDVAANRVEAERIVVLLLDDYNTAVDPAHMKTAKAVGRGVIDELGPSDLAAVLYTFTHKNGQEFTSDRARLLASVDRFVPIGRVPPPFAACPDNQCVHGAMRSAADILQRWPDRRKLLVYVSPEGVYQFGPRNIEQNQTEVNATGFSSVPDLQRTFHALQTANVTVYQYDPRGLKDSLDVMNGGIGMYADHTGGLTVTRTNHPEARVGDMFVENGSYYLLGIEATRRPASEEFRPIRVAVNRPGVVVRHRTGYYAERPAGRQERTQSRSNSAETELDRAMDGAAPTGDLPLTLTVAPFGRPGQRTATVAIVAGLDRPEGEARADVVTIAARAFDQNTALRTSKGVVTATLELTPRVAGRETHFDVPATLELPPGRYEIRLAMESSSSSLRGSAFMALTVPDFFGAPLSLSGVALGRMPPVRPTGRHTLANILPFTPTTVRTFARSDRVHALVRVYQGGKRQNVPVTLSARIVDSGNRPVYERAVTFEPAAFQGASRAVESGITLPLAVLSPGAHVLSIEARTSTVTEVRHVRFSVE
jgi:VWFA-related protein